METTNKRIQLLRESLGYSVEEFAKLLKVSRTSIYRYEGNNDNEQRELPISVAYKMNQLFGVSLDWLSGTSEIMYLEQSTNKLTEIYEALSEELKKQLFDYAVYLKNKEG